MRAVWKWVQRLPGFRKFFRARCRVSLFLLDEKAVVVRGLLAWVWVAYDPLSDSGSPGLGTAYRLRCSLGRWWRLMGGILSGLMGLHGIIGIGLGIGYGEGYTDTQG
ncbi:MAG: hypothetical protein QW756_04635 [Nitrososphaerota archaeon]